MNKEDYNAFVDWWYGEPQGEVAVAKLRLDKEGQQAKLAFKKGMEHERKKKDCKCQSFLVKTLKGVADQLYKWAEEAQNGGWSTVHVDPMRNKAGEIHQVISKYN